MRLTVLGKWSPWPSPDGACSGYLVQEGSVQLLLDCGTGVFSRLLARNCIFDLTAVLLTHTHMDHIADLIPLALYRLWGEPEREHASPIPLYVPRGNGVILERVGQLLGGMDAYLQQAYTIIEYGSGSELSLDNLKVRFHAVDHPLNAHALRIIGDRDFVYTGDTAFGDGAKDACRGADVMLSEATLEDEAIAAAARHLTSRQAGKLAASANVERLLLTHVRPGDDEGQKVRNAQHAFSGQVEAVKEGQDYDI